MKTKTLVIIPVALITLMLMAVVNAISVQATSEIVLKTTRLWAAAGDLRGRIYTGTVTVAIEDGSLVVTFETTDGWELNETHLYVGLCSFTIPKSAPGRFPYQHEDLGVTLDTYIIPLSDLDAECGDTLYVAAHAVVQKWMGDYWWEETGWAAILCGYRFPRGWGAYFPITIPCP